MQHLSLAIRDPDEETKKKPEESVRNKTLKYVDKWKVAVVVGMDEIHYLHYEPTFHGRRLTKEPNVIKVDGKIKRIVSDEEKFNGIYLLIAKEQSSKL